MTVLKTWTFWRWLIALWLSASATAQAAVILQYHHVSDSTPASTSLKIDEFAGHMAYLDSAGFTVLPLPDVIDALRRQQPLPAKTVVITFDDGYRNVLTNAVPILKRYDFPYTIFVASKDIDKGHRGMLSWAQLKQLAAEGATIANHSSYHHHLNRRLPGETQGQWRQRISADLLDAEAAIKRHTGQSWSYLAYPYGEYNQPLQALVAELGFIGIGQHSGAVASYSDFTALPRFPASGRYARLDSLKIKLNSLAMPVTALAGHEPQLGDNWQPELTVTLDTSDLRPRQLSCYILGERVAPTWLSDRQFSIRADKPLPVGRSRYNCTVPSKRTGQYYWFSHPWMRANPDGSWYAD